MKFLKVLGFLPIVILASCHSAKKIAKTTNPTPTAETIKDATKPNKVDSASLAKSILSKWQSNTLNYQTISGKLNVSIKMPNLDQSVTGNLRSAKDSLIWISLTGPFGIEGARARLTVDSALVINKLNSTVEKRSIDYIQKLVHQPLTFTDVQNILTGRMLLQNAVLQSFKGNTDGTWNFIFQQGSIQNKLTLDATNNRLVQNVLTDSSNPSRACTVQYKNFQNTAAGWLPFDINIDVQDKAPIKVELSYKQVNFNQTLDYPFNIPSKYSVRQ